jgi:uncharacterized protein
MSINRVIVDSSPIICLYREARRCAQSLHCRFTGTIGVTALAKRRGIIPSIRESLEKLRNAGLWMSTGLREQVCRKFG